MGKINPLTITTTIHTLYTTPLYALIECLTFTCIAIFCCCARTELSVLVGDGDYVKKQGGSHDSYKLHFQHLNNDLTKRVRVVGGTSCWGVGEGRCI